MKIECDDLTSEDWKTLALLGSSLVRPFGRVVGVPRGGQPFANALNGYCTVRNESILIVDDVLTTGSSLMKYATKFDHYDIHFLVAFNRGKPNQHVPSVFYLSPGLCEL